MQKRGMLEVWKCLNASGAAWQVYRLMDGDRVFLWEDQHVSKGLCYLPEWSLRRKSTAYFIRLGLTQSSLWKTHFETSGTPLEGCLHDYENKCTLYLQLQLIATWAIQKIILSSIISSSLWLDGCQYTVRNISDFLHHTGTLDWTTHVAQMLPSPKRGTPCSGSN